MPVAVSEPECVLIIAIRSIVKRDDNPGLLSMRKRQFNSAKEIHCNRSS